MSNEITTGYIELVDSLADACKVAEKQLSNSADAIDALRSSIESLPSIVKRSTDVISDFASGVADTIGTNSAAKSSLEKLTDGFDPFIENNKVAEQVVANAGDAIRGFDGKAESLTKSLASGLTTGLVNLGLAMIGIGFKNFLDDLEKLSAKQEQARKASINTEAALKNLGKGFYDSGKDAKNAVYGIDEFTDRINNIIKDQADFYDASKKKSYELNVDIALMDYYKETIHELAGEAGLTAAKQAKLNAAVAGINEICGTNIEVIDAANGKLSESVAVIDQSTDAWKRNAIAQATMDVYNEYARDWVKLTLEQEEVQRQLDEEMKKSTLIMSENGYEIYDNSGKIAVLNGQLSRLTTEVGTAKSKLDGAGKALTHNQDLTTSAAHGISRYIEQSSAWGEVLKNAQYSTYDLSKAFKNLGVTTSELERAGADNFAALAASFNGGADDLMAKCVELGIVMPGMFDEISNRLGEDIARGYVEGLDPHAAEEVMRVIVKNTIEAAKDEADCKSPSRRAAKIGMYLAEGFSQGIEDDESADLAAKRIAQLTLQTMQLEAAAEKASVIGEDFSAGFADGMKSLQHAVEACGIATSKAAKAGMESESTNASVWGGHMVGGLAEGIRGSVGLVQSAASFIAGSIKSFLHFSRPDQGPLRDYETWMPDMVGGLASTLRKAAPVIYAEARAVAEGISEDFNAGIAFGIEQSAEKVVLSTNNMMDEVIEKVSRSKTRLNLDLFGKQSTAMNNAVLSPGTVVNIGDVSYVPDSRMAELMAEVMNILVRENNMRRVSYA